VTDRATVTLGVDAGGKDANSATAEHYMALRRLLESECQGPYSSTIKEIALVLRIDGSVQDWGKRGVDNVRIQKKSGYATADIFVTSDVWRMADTKSIRSYFATEVVAAVRKIAESAAKAKVPLDGERLLLDVDRAIKKFLM
jgi:hypothetical protein